MTNITDTFSSDHRRCDRLFADAEEAITKGDWTNAGGPFDAFKQALLHHFDTEESILFTEVERSMGHAGGPTQVMRREHIQMRNLLQEMDHAFGEHNSERCLGLFETLMILMQQHNMKEEQVLYPMADHTLGGQATTLLQGVYFEV